VYIAENEQRLEEQLQDVSSVRVGLKDKTIKVNELEASYTELFQIINSIISTDDKISYKMYGLLLFLLLPKTTTFGFWLTTLLFHH